MGHHIQLPEELYKETYKRVLGDPMKGITFTGRFPTPEENRATSDYLTKELGNQFQGVSLIVPQSKLEEEIRKHV